MTFIINDAKGVQENKMQVNPLSHATKQSHERDLRGHGKEGVLQKKIYKTVNQVLAESTHSWQGLARKIL